VGGLLPASISSLERRYGLDSFESGLLSSLYDLGNLCVVMLYGYIGTAGHRPRILGFSLWLIALGAFIFALPQIAGKKYAFVDLTDTELCGGSNSATFDCNNDEKKVRCPLYPPFLLLQTVNSKLNILCCVSSGQIFPWNSRVDMQNSCTELSWWVLSSSPSDRRLSTCLARPISTLSPIRMSCRNTSAFSTLLRRWDLPWGTNPHLLGNLTVSFRPLFFLKVFPLVIVCFILRLFQQNASYNENINKLTANITAILWPP
jgi:hypothetical protein